MRPNDERSAPDGRLLLAGVIRVRPTRIREAGPPYSLSSRLRRPRHASTDSVARYPARTKTASTMNAKPINRICGPSRSRRGIAACLVAWIGASGCPLPRFAAVYSFRLTSPVIPVHPVGCSSRRRR